MTLADDIAADLPRIFADWGDTLYHQGSLFQGFFELAYVEVGDSAGFKPTFIGVVADMEKIPIEGACAITSPVNGYADKEFSTQVLELVGDGTIRLILEEI